MVSLWPLFLLLLLQLKAQAQQPYVNNKQLDCEKNFTTTLGFTCTAAAAAAASSCRSYLTFRSTPTYNTPVAIAYLLNADASQISRANNLPDVQPFPENSLVIVPLNCSCLTRRRLYQHDASYVLKSSNDTYFAVANNTYQGLTTCQSMIAQNPYNYRQLADGDRIRIPLRCACPSQNQTRRGTRYLLSYLVIPGDTIEDIARIFSVGVLSDIYDANELSDGDNIFPYTPLLVPLTSEPTGINASANQPPPPPPPPPPGLVTAPGDGTSSWKWVFVCVGVGAGVFALIPGVLLFLYCRTRGKSKDSKSKETKQEGAAVQPDSLSGFTLPSEKNSWSKDVRSAVDSLTVYEFEELKRATGRFKEANLIKGSVYRALINGDYAAVKMRDGSAEINLLKRINHSSIIRLSGISLHGGNTYPVYEYAEQGSLSDFLYQIKHSSSLKWKQRVQVAYDVADGLNYLHNYANPPIVHVNLTSSNVLLDGNTRAKLSNFRLARPIDGSNVDEATLQATRHVVGGYGYMSPEYIENGVITPKLDVFGFGVVILELLSGREAARKAGGGSGSGSEELLYATIEEVLGGENVREKLRGFMDPSLGLDYPLDMAHSAAQLARRCVARDLNSRPTMTDVFLTLSELLSASLDWDSSEESRSPGSQSHG